MVRPRAKFGSLRFSRLEKERLIVALLFSLCLHLGVWGGYEVGKKTGFWEKLHWPFQLKKVVLPKPVVQVVDPTVFVDVSQASTDAPKEAKYYSDRNSQAANLNADKDSNQPKLTGKQRDAPKTEDASQLVKSKPAAPMPPQNPAEPKPAEKASMLNPGATEKAKPTDTLHPNPKPTTPERPRKLSQARAQQPNQTPGLTVEQDGGVRNNKLVSAFDVKATPLGDYDAAVFEAIQQYWNDELINHQYASDRTGKVTITFELHSDGRVTGVQILKNEVGILLGAYCQASIEQAAPFGKWPDELRHSIGSTKRTITLTFIYY